MFVYRVLVKCHEECMHMYVAALNAARGNVEYRVVKQINDGNCDAQIPLMRTNAQI